MPSKFWWVFAAYVIVWLGIFGYLGSLLGRARTLEREVQRLKDETARR
jgi:CcmD family protein